MRPHSLVTGNSGQRRRWVLTALALLGVLLGLLAPTQPATRAGIAIADNAPTPPICSGNGSGCGTG